MNGLMGNCASCIGRFAIPVPGGTYTQQAYAWVNVANNTYTLTQAAISGSTVTYTGTITGGASNNTFNVSAWTGKGTFAAGAGTDTLNYTNGVSGIVLTNTSVAISGGANVTLSGFETANLTGGSSANTFDVTGWTGTGSLTGNGATSTVAATKNTDITLTNNSLTAGTMNMTLSGITLSAMGFPMTMFPVLFAIPRISGWLAQWEEMLLDPEQKIARPRQIYLGYDTRGYIPIDQRS